jgi:RNA polymerase sigma factor (sigma-70 family)
MSDAHLGTVVRRLHQLAAALPIDEVSDAGLLARYATSRDADAFGAIVRRHGPLVWRVCRRVLGRDGDAEDCFQATFLVLARRAAGIRKPAALASWLHGVAFRVARTAQARRRPQALIGDAEPTAATAEPGNESAWRELACMVEEEVHALPEKLRLAVLACYWQGLTNEEAALRLGWPAGTVKTRLARARELLHQRLLRRGVTLPVGTLVILLAPQGAQAALPPAIASALAAKTVAACTGGAVSLPVATLVDAAAGAALPAKFKLAGLALLVTALALGSAAALTQMRHDAAPADELPAALIDEPKPQDPPPPRKDADGIALPQGAVARLGSLRFNHGSHVLGFHFTPDGKTIVSHGSGSLCLWDAATGKERARIATDRFGFGAAAQLLPDGKTLLILSQQNDTLQTWDLEQQKQTRTLRLPIERRGWSAYQHHGISPDGKRCMTHLDSHVEVWDSNSGKELLRLPTAGDKIRRAMFAGNDWIVAADEQKRITIWDVPTGKQVRQFAHGGPAEVLSTSRDGRWLATLEHHTYAIDRLLEKDVVHVWDLATGQRKHTLAARPKSWFMGVQFSPDGNQVLAYRYGNHETGLTVWDTESGRPLRELPTGGEWSMTPDGRYLVVGGATFAVWDMKTGLRRDDDIHHDMPAQVQLSAAGDRVVDLGWSSFTTWDVATGRPLRTTAVPPYHLMPPYRCVSPDGRYLATFRGNLQQKIELLIWDVAAGQLLHTLNPSDPQPWPLFRTAFAPDSSLLATSESGKESIIRLWDVRTGKQVRAIKDIKARWGGRLDFSSDGRTLFITGLRAVAYDVATGAERFSWRVPPPPSSVKTTVVGGAPMDENDTASWRSLAFAPDASVAAGVLSAEVAPSERVKDRLALCDARTGKVIGRWSDSGKNGTDFEQVIFSDNGRLLATSDGSVIHVWEAATTAKVLTFQGHRDEIRSLSFSTGGWRLASASRDTTTLVWDLALALGASAATPATCWDDLASADARRAYAAIARLAATPAESVPFIDQRVKPVSAAEVQEMRRWIAELGSDEFTVRDNAYQRLAALGPSPVSLLWQALQKQPPLETRRRIEQLLDSPSSRPTRGEPLRTLRALTALERAGTPAARRVLERLAAGGTYAWLTLEARAACKRLPTAADRRAP